MRGTPSCSTTSACLPMARSTWQQASAEPIASPSGRACDVSTNRSRCPICRSTSSSMLCVRSTGFLAGPRSFLSPAAFLGPLQQLLDPRLLALRAINAKEQFRRAPQPQPVRQFAPDVSLGRLQPFHAPLGFVVVAVYIHQNLRRTAVFRQMHAGYADQPDARIAQFAFDQSFNFFAQRFSQPSPMILDRALLHRPPRVKRLRISEKQENVLGPTGPLSSSLVGER